MKKTALIIIAAVFCIGSLASAQDTAQQLQNVNIKILQLSAQRDYNKQVLDVVNTLLNLKADEFNKAIQQLAAQRQKLQDLPKPAPKVEPEPAVEKPPTK